MDRSNNWRTNAITRNLEPVKSALGRALFALSRFHRIHIIGCSRSGTTMLHLAMIYFENVVLSEFESEARYPYMRDRARLALRYGFRAGRKFFVTKRNFGWFAPTSIDLLIGETRRENIGLIHLVRDPRDVMLSRYPGSTQPYVSAEFWYRSISAGDQILRALADYPRKITIRYEDLVLNSERIVRELGMTFGLRGNAGAFPIDRVKDNFEHLNVCYASFALRNLSGLRNMEANSIGKWRQANNGPVTETLAPHVRDRLEAFCAEYAYH